MEKYKKVIHKKVKNNKFKISVPTWNEEFELPDRSYSYQIFMITLNIFYKNMRQLLIILQ